MKLLLVLTGESYRSGVQMSRTRGTINYIERQVLASLSHINLINKIKDKYTIDTDVVINTYKLNENDDNELINIYKKNSVNLIGSKFNNSIFPNENSFLNNVYDDVNNLYINNDNYDFVLFIRIDLYLKNFFIENINFDNNKIKFIHIDSNIDVNNEHIPSVCHQIMIYPKKFFYTLTEKIIYNETHGIYKKLINNNINKNEIKFFINTIHVCSTDLGWNPFYVNVGRKYSCGYNTNLDCQQTVNYIYDENNDKFVLNKEQSVERWNNYIINEEKNENDGISQIVNFGY